jgi:predicted metal-dependent phosphotriesterase family hydrolase
MFVGQLRSLGVTDAEFTAMLVDNPANLLGV